MFKKYDKETGITTWYLQNWWDKCFYVAGALWVGFLLLCFVLGVLEAIFE